MRHASCDNPAAADLRPDGVADDALRYPQLVLLVPCLACGAMLEQGALRCRFCNAAGRPAPPSEPRPRPRAAPGATPPRRAHGAEPWLEQLVNVSRDLFGGP